MQRALEPFRQARKSGDGFAISRTLNPYPPPNDPDYLYRFYRASNAHQVESDIRFALKYNNRDASPEEGTAWTEVFVNYWKAIGEIIAAEEAIEQGRHNDVQMSRIYEAWKGVTNSLTKNHGNGSLPAWTIVCLYNAGKYLRVFAIRADEQSADSKTNGAFRNTYSDDIYESGSKHEKLEDTARELNRMFSVCLADRNPLSESRKWGTYYMANLQFKTHFKLGNMSLSKTIMRSISSSGDMPPLESFPKAHQVTFKYYTGILAFLEEDYAQAESRLVEAWELCHRGATKNRELILTYLIPCRLVAKHQIPSAAFLSQFPRLQANFGPLMSCIKRGDLSGFDAALVAGEHEFVKRRIYLTLERGRDIALRNLLRKVFIAGGYEPLKEGQSEAQRIRRTRIPLAEFVAAFRVGIGPSGGQVLDDEEVECMLANQIYKGLMKGYISREHQMVVLNKKGAFPGTGV